MKILKKEDAVILMVDSHAGQYIPQEFLESIKNVKGWKGISSENKKTIEAGPDNEWYWEAWTQICDNAKFTSKARQEFRLYQDEDLWAVCYEDMTEEEKENFGFNED